MSSVPSTVNRLDEHLQKLLRQGVTLKGDEVKEANCSLQNIVTTGTTPGFAKIKVGKDFHSRTPEAVKRKIESWCVDNYLCRDKVIQWLIGIVDKVLQTVKWPRNMSVKPCTSGPAVTLKISENNKELSVDLVPVFTFGADKWPAPPLRQIKNLPGKIDTSLKWCVVPKPPREDISSKQQWRMSFYMYEKCLMNGLSNMKPVVKLMKLLRDKQNWVSLSSYYIKTLFLLEQEKQRLDDKFWNKGLGYLFMHMLGQLENYFQREEIPFFWDKRSNLIKHLKKDEIKNMRGRVTHLRKMVERALSSPGQDLSSVVNELFVITMCCSAPRREETNNQAIDPQQAEGTDWNALVENVSLGVAFVSVGVMIARRLYQN
ncbi:cyclic GMP-AMP synthase-like isoform X6 [Zootermopsis nevadensis]|uniref:cyclic GMP-AMP synthase-like isoform X6 n=1 Tax=Zootermopsis nevadensis TaxID=136037 RepID=UPI000B8EA281|nr:cyclic GMP-AMP synthase-like isoform X6 [Zootermopsis nevadensis]